MKNHCSFVAESGMVVTVLTIAALPHAVECRILSPWHAHPCERWRSHRTRTVQGGSPLLPYPPTDVGSVTQGQGVLDHLMHQWCAFPGILAGLHCLLHSLCHRLESRASLEEVQTGIRHAPHNIIVSWCLQHADRVYNMLTVSSICRPRRIVADSVCRLLDCVNPPPFRSPPWAPNPSTTQRQIAPIR